MDTCLDCGHPLERADDFWYCDNPDCPGRARASEEKTESGSTGAVPARPEAQPGVEKQRR